MKFLRMLSSSIIERIINMDNIIIEKENWINTKFFVDIHNALKQHIAPKSKVVMKEINDIIEIICRSHGYYWSIGPDKPI